ncbi:MAG: 2-oxoacid:acceptor oxidoreductase subunit alpha [Acidaminobacter sp.]|uniref:2-oxoacid:acceptor oxidoreductase subunit alpha n=1 Tax=Acidaminobacter sp. TaxID=1872102 RepID=UPI001381F9CE|nr:2-oxoacid:acceptor oxidoreductase subunit alpha [Acidaminobacter sp.]MZQ97007.1 2-oxoacid:acceptor oxidoreductase subunit alpha [Acidaminobacter sp.]
MSKRIVKLMQGNEACVAGALAAGMKFFAGYPITPSTEIAEGSAEKLPEVGGKFIQMEDEIAGIAAAIGGSIAGFKSMTATSGPGFSLKQENIGYAALAEIPLVIVNVMRGGPSTGLPTSPGQGDVMQAMWGTHGDHPVIAISPQSVTEMYYETVRAFNLAEKYRTPVILMPDEVVGHMRERIEIPNADELEIFDRLKPVEGEDYIPYGVREGDLVPRMAGFGEGYRYHITGLFHDDMGFPTNSTVKAGVKINRLMAKITDNLEDLISYDEYLMDDAEIMIVAYGSTARTAKNAINKLRAEGIKVGMLRPITIWPYPVEATLARAKQVNKVLVVEHNLGQLMLEVERVVKSEAELHFLGRADGDVFVPADIVKKVKEVL